MSKPEAILAQQIAWAKLSEPVRELAAINGRRYRFDFAWPTHNLLVEVQGGTFAAGKLGHSSGMGINRDNEKMILAQLAGWKVFQVDTKQVHSGQALRWIQEALEKN